MIRLLLLMLLALVAVGKLFGDVDGLKNLGDVEDLLFRDEQALVYSDPGKERTPDALLNQFNSAKESPTNRRRLNMYLRELEIAEQQVIRALPQEEINRRINQIKDILENRQTCDSSAPGFRSLDGTCNNIANSDWGSAGKPLFRAVTNAYDDQLSKPRTQSAATTGGDLPNARLVALAVFGNKHKVNNDFTALIMHVGQITDHDITAVRSQIVDCSSCSVDGECFSILLAADDPVFGCRDPACFAFPRSRFEEDAAGVRQQVNSITTYLDASFTYGSDDVAAADLTNDDGTLKHNNDSVTGRELLPPNENLAICTGTDAERGIFCGLAGDGRAAEQPGLTSMHTLFLREHNRVVNGLKALDTSLSGTELYQRARKIVGAEWQHFLYNEYVPLIVGEDLYVDNNLAPSATYAYAADVDPSISNVFAVAAFRFGHTQVPSELTRANKNYVRTCIPKINLLEGYFNATYIYDTSIKDGAVDSILRGMLVQQASAVDGQFSESVTNNLFGDPVVEGDGFDLTALNIQRARDHGLPSYPVIRKDFCGLSDIDSYDKLKSDGGMTTRDKNNIEDIYGDNGVKDIDAFVGLVLEGHLPNTLVGPTLACIFADQFRRLKFGDRFFYKNLDQFTQDQMDEIEKATFARFICDNVEAVTKAQPFAFVQPINFNSSVAADTGDGIRGYSSFYEYSRSGSWPHKKRNVLDGLDNRRVDCDPAAGKIPVVDLSKFV